MEKTTGKITGIWQSLITPFDEQKKIDLVAAERYIKMLEQHDFKGYLIGGSVGEGMLLSDAELADYIKLVRKISSKPIMMCVAAFNFLQIEKRLDLDYDYLCATPCIYFKPHANATIEYFKTLAARSRGPIVLYNNPSRVGCAITEHVYDQLAGVENIIGMKECDDMQFEKLSNKHTHWQWLTGNDDYMCNPFFINNYNSAGVITTLGNIAPDVILNLWKHLHDQNARQVYIEKWADMCRKAYSIPNPQVVKIVLAKWGVIKPYFRAQFDPLPDFSYLDTFTQLAI